MVHHFVYIAVISVLFFALGHEAEAFKVDPNISDYYESATQNMTLLKTLHIAYAKTIEPIKVLK